MIEASIAKKIREPIQERVGRLMKRGVSLEDAVNDVRKQGEVIAEFYINGKLTYWTMSRVSFGEPVWHSLCDQGHFIKGQRMCWEQIRILQKQGRKTITQGDGHGSYSGEAGSFGLGFQFDMALDKGKYGPFISDLKEVLRGRDECIVVEPGMGLMNISVAAAGMENVKTVVGIEINEMLFNYVCDQIVPNLPEDIRRKLVLINDDIRNVTQDDLRRLGVGSIDAICCELMDTGGISEFQVPVMQDIARRWDAFTDDTRVIPYGWSHSVSLVNHPMNHDEILGPNNIRPYTINYARPRLITDPSGKEEWKLTNTIMYQDIPFGKRLASIEIEERHDLNFEVKRDGIVDYLLIETDTHMNSVGDLGSHPTLNLPLFIPLIGKEVKNLIMDSRIGE